MTQAKNYIPIEDRTLEFALRIVKLCQFLDQKPGVNRTLSNQLLRSGTSIGANVEESIRFAIKSKVKSAPPVRRKPPQ